MLRNEEQILDKKECSLLQHKLHILQNKVICSNNFKIVFFFTFQKSSVVKVVDSKEVIRI